MRFRRESILKDITNHYGCTRKAAKNLFIRLLNGGGELKWRLDHNVPDTLQIHEQIIEVLETVVKAAGYKVGSLAFDGCMGVWSCEKRISRSY